MAEYDDALFILMFPVERLLLLGASPLPRAVVLASLQRLDLLDLWTDDALFPEADRATRRAQRFGADVAVAQRRIQDVQELKDAIDACDAQTDALRESCAEELSEASWAPGAGFLRTVVARLAAPCATLLDAINFECERDLANVYAAVFPRTVDAIRRRIRAISHADRLRKRANRNGFLLQMTQEEPDVIHGFVGMVRIAFTQTAETE